MESRLHAELAKAGDLKAEMARMTGSAESRVEECARREAAASADLQQSTGRVARLEADKGELQLEISYANERLAAQSVEVEELRKHLEEDHLEAVRQRLKDPNSHMASTGGLNPIRNLALPFKTAVP